MKKEIKIFAIDSNWNTLKEFTNFEEADYYWDHFASRDHAIQILYKDNKELHISVYKSV